MNEVTKDCSQISVGDVITGMFGNWDGWYEVVSIRHFQRTVEIKLLRYAFYSRNHYPTTSTRTPLDRELRCSYPNNIKFRVLKLVTKADQLIAKIKYLDKKYDWKGKSCRS